MNINNQIPVLWEDKEDCCGCTACYAICPASAISMEEDDEGFLYPKINPSICVKCYVCQKVCPIKQQISFHFKKK